MAELRSRLTLKEVVLSDVTEADLLSLAKGCYASFPEAFWERMEPPSIRPSEEERVRRFARILSAVLDEPDTLWRKATLASDSATVIGHAGWATPKREWIFNPWRSDAVKELGYEARMGWTDEDVKEMWSGYDITAWDGVLKSFDETRAKVLGFERHWHLSPIWVLPEYHGRGVSSLLLKEVIEVADKSDPPVPMYLESTPNAKVVYEHFGWRPVEGLDRSDIMLRRGPRK